MSLLIEQIPPHQRIVSRLPLLPIEYHEGEAGCIADELSQLGLDAVLLLDRNLVDIEIGVPVASVVQPVLAEPAPDAGRYGKQEYLLALIPRTLDQLYPVSVSIRPGITLWRESPSAREIVSQSQIYRGFNL